MDTHSLHSMVNVLAFLLTHIEWVGLAIYAVVLARRVRRQPDTRPSMIKRFLVVASAWLLLSAALDYRLDVQYRESATNCKRSTSPDGQYIGEKCYVPNRNTSNVVGRPGFSGLLKLYDATTGELLAREFVPNPSEDMQWKKGELMQWGDDDNGTAIASISLPPTAWDRFLVRFP